MHGNVCEWVQDKWHSDYDGAPTEGSAWESEDGGGRHSGTWYCGSSGSYFAPDNCNRNIGFRLLEET